MGYQIPHTGNAYAGAYCFESSGTNYREYLGASLIQSLNIGTKYFLSVYISRSDFPSWATNHFGFKFSTVQYNYLTNPAPVNNFAHYYSPVIVTDSIGWTKISGSFIADSNYQYVILGNFYDSISTNFIAGWYTPDAAYYLIDDVCVSTDSLTCNQTVGINAVKNEEDLILFPNPFSDKINISLKRNEVVEFTLFDMASRKIFNQSFTNSISINTEQLSKGIYLYEVRNKNGVIKKGKVVKD